MTTSKLPKYTYLGLPEYMGKAAEHSVPAPVSRVLDMGDEVRPVRISHLALATTNFDAVANWWQTVLNAKPSMDADNMRFMAFDDEHHKVVVFEMAGVAKRTGPKPEFTGMHHIAFSYGSFEDLAATYLRLKKSNIVPWRAINHGTSFALDYHDPDFNTCELQCTCFPAEQGEKPELNEWLATGAFNRNPIGVLFDMDEAIAAYEAGCDIANIVSPYVMKVGEHTEDELRTLRMKPIDPDKDENR
jgi:catechol 2,3-dioxygenase-like lactoylglutathione lyase family enzyme